MQTKRAIALIIVSVLIALPAIAAFSAISVKREFTLPTFEGYPFRPRVTGDWVIASQIADKNNNGAVKAVNVYNLVTNEVTCAFEGKAFWPEAGGNCAIWSAAPDEQQAFGRSIGDSVLGRSGSKLVALDIVSSRYYNPGLRSGSANQYDIWGDYAVWTSQNRAQLCYMNLKTGQQWMPAGSGQHYAPSICGSLIVWLDDLTNSDAKNRPMKLRAFDFAALKNYDIPQDPNAQHNTPVTDGKTIVWWESKPNVVMAYDTKTGKVTKVADGYFPDIDNGLVVYMKSDSKVYGKDLKTGQEFQISKGISNQSPTVSGKWVAWTVSSQDNKIHCAELTGIGSK